MKNVLLLVHDDRGQEARLQVALDIVRGLDGHLSCLDVVRYPMLLGVYDSAAGEAMLLDEEQKREDQNRATLNSRLSQELVSWDFQEALGEIDQCVLKASRLADLIVLNRRLDRALAPDMLEIATRVALKARRPVVAVPDLQQGFKVNGRALIAWDGSEAVANTLVAVVPLLREAEAVRLLVVDDGQVQGSASEAATYLSRHRIHAEIQVTGDSHLPTGELIAGQAARWRADYMVMGAFGHRPAMEYLFGGVTRHMLECSGVPVVLAH